MTYLNFSNILSSIQFRDREGLDNPHENNSAHFECASDLPFRHSTQMNIYIHLYFLDPNHEKVT